MNDLRQTMPGKHPDKEAPVSRHLTILAARLNLLAELLTLMPICPRCHAMSPEQLEVHASIADDGFWRCSMCGHVWKQDAPIQPKAEQRRYAKADSPRRRKSDTA